MADLIFIAAPFLTGPLFAGRRERRLVLDRACFLEHFEQLEDAGEWRPGVGALGAHSSLDPPVRSAADIKEKANRLPRLWCGVHGYSQHGQRFHVPRVRP